MERKIVLITGATSGIGEGCAHRFAEGGYDLIITGRNEEKLREMSLSTMEGKCLRLASMFATEMRQKRQ